MPEIPTPEAIATRYEVSCLPEGHPDRRHFTVTIRRVRTAAGTPGWVVTDGDAYWTEDGSTAKGAVVILGLGKAISVAQRVAPTLVVYGRTAADVLARWGSHG